MLNSFVMSVGQKNISESPVRIQTPVSSDCQLDVLPAEVQGTRWRARPFNRFICDPHLLGSHVPVLNIFQKLIMNENLSITYIEIPIPQPPRRALVGSGNCGQTRSYD